MKQPEGGIANKGVLVTGAGTGLGREIALEFARQMFARAIVIDPGYAQAFAGVADCSSFLYMYFEASEDNLKEAVTASRRAVELDPESAEAHASRGLAESLNKNYEAAEKEFELSLRRSCSRPIIFMRDPVGPRRRWSKPVLCSRRPAA